MGGAVGVGTDEMEQQLSEEAVVGEVVEQGEEGLVPPSDASAVVDSHLRLISGVGQWYSDAVSGTFAPRSFLLIYGTMV